MVSLKKIENYSKALCENAKAAIKIEELTQELGDCREKFEQISSAVNFEWFTEINLENSEEAQQKAYDLYSEAFDDVKSDYLDCNATGNISDHHAVSKYAALHIVICDIIYVLKLLKEAETTKAAAQKLQAIALHELYEQCVDGSKVRSEEISNASIASILDAHLGPITK
jgi:hypothetical protein